MFARKLRTLAFFGLFLSLLLIVSLLLLELISRIFDPLGVSYYPDNARYMDTMIIEEPLGYRNRPSLNDDFFGHNVKLNSLGLRDEEYDGGNAEENVEILFLGDSVVFGVGVGNEDTLPAQLEVRLNSSGKKTFSTPVNVINMGCISYNTEQELLHYKQFGQHFNPELMLLMFSSNDIEPKMWIFNRRDNPLVRFAQKSYAVSLLYLIKKRLVTTLSSHGNDNSIQWSAYTQENPRWISIQKSLVALNDIAKSKGIPFVVLGQGAEIRSWTMVADVAKNEGFAAHLINPFADKRWLSLNPDHFIAKKGGGHLNAQGLGMYSQLIEELLVSEGYLDLKL